jgi:cell division protein FtsB
MRGRESIAPSLDIFAAGARADRRRVAWHALAVVAAAALAWLVFAAYRQPDLLLDLAALNLC